MGTRPIDLIRAFLGVATNYQDFANALHSLRLDTESDMGVGVQRERDARVAHCSWTVRKCLLAGLSTRGA